MKRKICVCMAFTVAVLLIVGVAGCGPGEQAETESTENSSETTAEQSETVSAGPKMPPVNVLIIACEGKENSFPLNFFLITVDNNTNEVRFTNFFYETQIDAVTTEGEPVSIPMYKLTELCDMEGIIDAFENMYGIAVDKYLIYRYDNNMIIDIFKHMCPITVDIPEEYIGSGEGTLKKSMERYSDSTGEEITPVDAAGEQELGPLALLSYFHTIPEWVYASEDDLTRKMEDYKYWDAKNEYALSVYKPVFELMGEQALTALGQSIMEGQDTNITDDDIAAWAKRLTELPDGKTPYLTIPGFEDIGLEKFEGDPMGSTMMLTYDKAEAAEKVQAFVNGE